MKNNDRGTEEERSDESFPQNKGFLTVIGVFVFQDSKREILCLDILHYLNRIVNSNSSQLCNFAVVLRKVGHRVCCSIFTHQFPSL